MNFLRKLDSNYLLKPKILYTFINLQYYTLHQFRTFFIRDKFRFLQENEETGDLEEEPVTEGQVSHYTGIIMFTTFFTSIVIGKFADKKHNHKSLLFLLTILSTIIFLTLYLTHIMEINPNILWSTIFLYLMLNIPKQPLLDKIVLETLAKDNNISSYGKQRVWGSVAYGFANTIIEAFLLYGSIDGKYNYNNLIYYCLITTAISALAILFFIKSSSHQATEQEAVSSSSGSIKDLLLNFEFMFFLTIMFLNAITRSAMALYLPYYQKDVLKVEPYELPESWPGWLVSVVNVFNKQPISTLAWAGLIFEMSAMFFSDSLLSRFGLFLPLLFAQVLALVRFMAYAVINPDSEHVYAYSFFFELIKGMYFGLAHMSAVHIAMKLAPPHLKTTAQMVYQGTFNALGSLVSGVLFGKLFDSNLKSKDASVDVDQKYRAYQQLFIVNIVIMLLTIGVYTIKYGIRDRVLLNKDREDEKLAREERRWLEQEEMSKKDVSQKEVPCE